MAFVARRPGVDLGAMTAVKTLNGNRVAVPRVVADFVQPLATHGLRRIVQIRLDTAVVSAAGLRIKPPSVHSSDVSPDDSTRALHPLR